jgi:hypothetical protein
MFRLPLTGMRTSCTTAGRMAGLMAKPGVERERRYPHAGHADARDQGDGGTD